MFEVVCQIDAHDQVVAFVRAGVIPERDVDRVLRQIRGSGLPLSCPSDVRERLKEYTWASIWVAHYADPTVKAGSQNFVDHIDGDEVAEVVHEFLLASPYRTLGSQ